MILYHGTNVDFDSIDLSRAEPYKDFGTGFYATAIYEQAVQMAKRKSRILEVIHAYIVLPRPTIFCLYPPFA